MKKLTCYILSFIFVFLVIILSCERKRFDNPYDPEYIPDPPKLLSPQDGEICDFNPPFFEWEYLGEKAGYEIEIDTLIDFNGENLFEKSLSWPSFDAAEFDLYFADTVYYWRIRGTRDRNLNPIPWGDWSTPQSFQVRIPIISTFQCSTDIYDLDALDTLVFMTDEAGYLSVFNFSDIRYPLLISQFYIGDDRYGIFRVSNQFLYLAAIHSDSIEIVLLEINKLPIVSLYSEFSFYRGGKSYDIAFENLLIAIRKGDSYSPDTIRLYNVSNPDSILEGKFEHDYSYLRDIWIYENSLSISSRYKIHIYDISNIEYPTLKDSLSFQEYDITFIGIQENYLYIRESYGAVEIFDISNPFNPALIGSFPVDASIQDLKNGYLIAGSGYLKTFYTLASPTVPQYIGGLHDISISSFAISSKFIFSKSSSDEIEIFKINE